MNDSGIISIYIAGKFRGDNAWEIERNIRRAEEISLIFCQHGVQADCPHTMYRNFSGAAPDDVWLALTMEMLRRDDAIYLLKDWRESSGSRGEYEEAGRLGLPRFFEDETPPEVLALSLAGIQAKLPRTIDQARPVHVAAIYAELDEVAE